jgi:hypothetical protein
MPQPPAQPKIYHIVHVDRLASIWEDGCLWADAEVVKRGQPGTTISMGGIKARRLGLTMECHPGDHVGDFVPFYFCPRLIMLYVIHYANHPELASRGGQGPIVHLEADLHEVVAWAATHGRKWAFSLSNAGAYYTPFRSRIDQLDEINRPAVAATDFRGSDVKEGKQAEFLVDRQFAWRLVRRIGVSAPGVAQQVANAMSGVAHRPVVEIRRDWYF